MAFSSRISRIGPLDVDGSVRFADGKRADFFPCYQRIAAVPGLTPCCQKSKRLAAFYHTGAELKIFYIIIVSQESVR
jgi:hypothetical protein